MRSFLLHAILFSLLIAAVIAGYCWIYKEYFPAPRLTRNVSLNEQMKRVRKISNGHFDHSPNGTVNLLAVGSSMSLNNLNSQAVIEHFKDSNYVNVGSWSTRMNQTAKISALLIDILKPRTVLLTSNMEDWMTTPDYFTVDTIMLRDYITEWSTIGSYLRTLRPSYYLREMENNKQRMTDPEYFDFLGFDPWGGASINVPPENVTADREANTVPRPDQIDQSLYEHLEWLAARADSGGIDLIFIQAPYRENVQTDELRSLITTHEYRVKNILEAYGHTFISTTDRSWPNELYIDPSHLKAQGAYMFTQYALSKLNDSGHVQARGDAGKSLQPHQVSMQLN